MAMVVIAACNAKSTAQTDKPAIHPLEVPAGAGSSGPHLAARDGKVVLSWLDAAGEQDRLLYSTLGDRAWTEPAVVATGDGWFVNWADFPSVVPISDSLWAAHWLVRQPAGGYAYDVFLALSEDGGKTWSKGVKPHDDGTPTEHGFVTLFPREAEVGLIWLDGRNMANAPSDATNGMTLRTASVSSGLEITDEAEVDGLVCDCCQTDVAIGDLGAIAVYRNRTDKEIRDIYVARLIGNEWQPGFPVADDGWTINGCPVNGPVIAADDNRVAVAWFTGADHRPRVRVARSEDSGASFGTPVDVVPDASFGRVGIALLPGNVLAVSWLCEVSEKQTGVCLRTVSSDNRQGPVHVVSGQDNVSSFSVPQLARSGGSLIAAWTANVDGSSGISSSAIPIASLN